MTNLVDIAKQMTAAWENKDADAMRSFLHEDYHFKGPMIELDGPDACIECMMSFPVQGRNKNCEVITQGSTLVHIADWEVTSPFQATIPFVEIMEFENGKVKNVRMFLDTAQFPTEFVKQMEAMKAQAA